tara:strand:- start:1225 stop:4374 length:3150 start_codon:yes stop_codon:yes gene_type:complete
MAKTDRSLKLNPISTNQLSSLIVGDAGKPRNIGQPEGTELEYLTEGNVPISEQEKNIREIRKTFGDKKNEILSSFWDSVKGGSQTAFDLYNYGPKGPPKEIVQERAMEAQQKLEIIKNQRANAELNEEKLANRPDVREVRAQIAQIIAAAEKREQLEPGSVNQDELEQDLVKFGYEMGYTPREIQGGPDVQAQLMPDPFGLATSSPDPFPEAKIAAEITGSIGGNILGYRIGAKAFGTGAMRGLKATPGPFWARIGGAMVGGFTSVMAANYGYETSLDIMNQAGVFGEKGINRPNQSEKIMNAMNAGEFDAKITLGTASFIPAVQMVRNLTRASLGAGKNEMRLAEISQALSKKFTEPGTYEYPGLGKFKVTKEGDAILGISDLTRFGGIRTVKQTLGKFPIISGGITGNLRVKATKLNQILTNMTDSIGPYMTYGRLSEVTRPAAFATATKYNKHLAELADNWTKTADSFGDLVVIGGGHMDPKGIAKQFILSVDNKVGVGLDGKILPTAKSYPMKKWLEENFLLNADAISYARSKEILTKELPDLMKQVGEDGWSLQFVQDFKQSFERTMAVSPKSAEVLAAKEAFDTAYMNGKLLFDTPIAKALGIQGMDMYGYRVKMLKQGTKFSDQLLKTAKFMESPEAMKNFHQLVGDDIFRASLRRHVDEAYKLSLKPFKGQSEVDSLFSGFLRGVDDPRKISNMPSNEASFLDVDAFKKNLGIFEPGTNEFQTLNEAFKLASRGYTPGSKLPSWAKTGSSELIDAGAREDTVRILADGSRKYGVVGRMPTTKEMLEFTQVLEKSFAGGIPDISTFIARRAQISGLRGALRAFTPGAKTGAAGSGAGALMGSSLFSTVLFSLIARQTGKVLTNPVNMKAFKYLIDPNTPKNSVAAARALEVIGINFKNDLDDLDRTLASIESEQLRNNDIQNFKQTINQTPTNNENMMNEFEKRKQQINEYQKQKQFNEQREQSIPPTVVGANASSSPTSTAGSPVVGSSIASNTTMNPNAAASLYTGNTDAALANQFGNPAGAVNQMPRMAAQGGIISLVS